MASRSNSKGPDRPPAATPEGRQNQLVAMAFDLAEEQIRAGTATAQVITHFLKLGTQREKLEQKRIEHENLLLEAKVDSMKSAGNMEKLYQQAIKAMRTYAGLEDSDEPEDQELHGTKSDRQVRRSVRVPQG